MILTGTTAALHYECVRVAKCINFDLKISRETKETTKLGYWDRTYLAGLRNTTATALVLYDPDDAATVALFNGILADTSSAVCFKLVFDNIADLEVDLAAVITDMSPSVRFGEAIAASVSMQCSGKPDATFST